MEPPVQQSLPLLLLAAGVVLTSLAVALAALWRGRAIRARRALRGFHARALSQLGEAVIGSDTEFVIHSWNHAAERMYGFRAEEVLGRPVAEVLVSEMPDGAGTEGLLDDVRRRGTVTTVARRRRKDGSWLDVEISVTAVEDERGRRVGYLGVQRDVTERRRHEAAMRVAEAQIELLSTRAPAGIFQTDARGQPVFLNEMIVAMTGLPPEKLAGGGWLQAVHPEDQARVAEGWKEAWAAGSTFRAELRLGSGTDPTWVVASAMTLDDEEGNRSGAVGVLTDVTEAHRIAERLSRAERMASVGTLAAGMAHEVNNPLAAVMSGISFAAREIEGREGLSEAAEALAEAEAAGRRVARIVRDLQAFAEVHDEVERIDLRKVVEGAVGLVPEALRRRARLVLDLSAAPEVEASPSQVQRVVLHLLCNAFQAIPADRAWPGEVHLSTGTAPGGRALVEIRDDGAGIPPEHLAHLFEPFFTTRGVGDGTGLGLSVCHGLVAALDGDLEVASAPGQGSTFRVLLPPAPPEVPDPAPTPWPPPEHAAEQEEGPAPAANPG